MALNHQRRFITEHEYLAAERDSEIRHEHIEGQIYAMAGATKNRDRITWNVARHFGNHLEHRPCDVFSSNVKVKALGNFYYPDAMAVCGDQTNDEYYSETPLIIIQVLSETTRKTDQTLKRLAYQSLPSLREYVLIEQDFVDVEICRRGNH